MEASNKIEFVRPTESELRFYTKQMNAKIDSLLFYVKEEWKTDIITRADIKIKEMNEKLCEKLESLKQCIKETEEAIDRLSRFD